MWFELRTALRPLPEGKTYTEHTERNTVEKSLCFLSASLMPPLPLTHAKPLAFMFASRTIEITAPNTNFTLDVSVAQVGCVYTLFALS